jgi:two-component system cell cycle sensor histidine kinase/response regulator CckA
VRQLLGENRRLVVTEDASPWVWVDSGQLEQVVINLALNSRDAMPSGGTVSLTISEATLPFAVHGGEGTVIPAGWYATLIVRDTGAGMDAGTLRHLFEPFFTTKPVGEGTGLGLAAAHGIVMQNDGYITVESAPGKGAVFTVYLPALSLADRVEPEGQPPGIRVDATHAGATVLVVDDEPALRAVAARSLKQAGFRVLQAADGGDALELIDRHGAPDLVLTDILMPGIGGVELVRRLRDRWPTLPILFMSGYSAEELGRRGAIISEGELIHKPFTPRGLAGSVAAALSRVG